MKLILSLLLFCTVVLFSCTDRDDVLDGVQVRVQNNSGTTFTEVALDSLVFGDLKPDEIAFYQRYNDSTLPSRIVVSADSLEIPMAIDDLFVADSVTTGLYTYRITEFSNESGLQLELIKD